MIKNCLDQKYNLLRPVKTFELVRLGRDMVGGYIVDLGMIEKTDILITLGVGPEWSFESDFLKMKNNCKVYIYDHNLSSIPYIKEIWKYLRRFLLLRVPYKAVQVRLDAYKDYRKFFRLDNVKFYNEKINFPTKRKNEVLHEKKNRSLYTRRKTLKFVSIVISFTLKGCFHEFW